MAKEIKDVLYDFNLFPLILLYEDSKPITINDLKILDVNVTIYRDSNEKFDLDHARFYDTLTKILSGKNELLKIRAILLIFMMKNIFDTTPIFEILLTEDILNIDNNVVYTENVFNTHNRYFNDIFFNELSKHPLLILNFVEIVKSFVKRDSLGYEALYPIIHKIITANERSMNPVSSDKLIFMDESDVKDKDREKIENLYPIILPFNMKRQKYLRHVSHGTTLYITVSRENILNSVWILDDVGTNDFKLNVSFGEGSVDCGGPTREYIDLAFKEIVKPETGLFDLRNGFYYFKYHKNMTEELKKKYRAVGILLAITILHHYTIPIRFPRYFYKKLLHKDIYIADLNVFDPSLYDGVKYILNNHITPEDFLDFIYIDPQHDDYGIDLTNFTHIDNIDNYVGVPLDDNNKEDYVSKLTEWILDISVREAFQSFEEGYRRISTSPMLYDSFTLDEIDKIVSGDKIIDWDSLKASASYSGYTSDSTEIQWFWTYFSSLTDDKKFEALKFITGTTAIPVGGLKDIRISFVKTTNYKFPRAHTCFSQIDLPQYKTYNELVDRCSEAFPNSLFGFS